MPRVRADDYDLKASAILDSAAALFVRDGYTGAKLQDVAKACGVTKSMLYHYFPTKDDLLFAMLQEHLQRALESLRESLRVDGTPDERLTALVAAYIEKSNDSRRRHMVAMADVKYLPADKQEPLIAIQRDIVDVATKLLRVLKPGLPRKTYKPYAMLLLGMMNWTDMWYRPDGPMKREELRERLTHLFLHGFLAASA